MAEQKNLRLVRMADFRNRALVASCRELLELSEAGIIVGHAFVVKFGPGDHRAGLTGDYGRLPAEALSAAFMLERHLTGGLAPTFTAAR